MKAMFRIMQNIAYSLRDPDMNLYPERFFINFLRLERKRSERSHRPFMLVVIGLKGFPKTAERREIIKDITRVLSSTTRDIDMKGWYKHNESIGIIFNEISHEQEFPGRPAVYPEQSVGKPHRVSRSGPI